MKKKIFIPAALHAAFFLAAATGHAQEVQDPREGWFELWHELLVDITVLGVVFATIALYLLIKYRRRHPDDVGTGKEVSTFAALSWVIIPGLIFLADDVYLGAKNFELWNVYRNVPKNAYVVEATGRMWSWGFKYPEGGGIETTNELRVPAGRPVEVKITSADVIHSLSLPYYKVKWDAQPGRSTHLWFYPKEPGEHVLTCVEYCGMMHSNMYGKVIVMPEKEFDKWVEENRPKGGSL